MPENLFKPKQVPTSQPAEPLTSQPVSQPVVEPATPVPARVPVERTTKPAANPVVSAPAASQPISRVDVESVTFKPAKAASRVELEEFKFVPANAATPTGQDYELSQEDTKELLTRLRAAYDKAPATYNQQVAPVFIQFSKERGITPADLMAGAARAGSDLQEIRRVAGQEYGDPEFRLTGQAAVGQALMLLQTRNLLPAVKTTKEAEQRATIRAKERNTIDMLPEEDRQRKAERATQLSLQAPTFAPASESYALGSPVASEDPEVAKGEEAARAQAIVEAIPPARRLKYTTGTERLSSDSLALMKDAAEQIIGAEGVLMVINGEPINFRSTDARSVLDEMKKQGVDLSRYGDEAGQLEAAGRVGNEVLRRAFGRSMNELAALRTVNGITTPVRLRIPYQMLMGISRSGEFDPVKGGPLFKPEDLEMTPEQILDREGLSGLPEAILVATAPQVEIVGFKAGGAPGESQQAVLLRQQSATETWFDRSAMLYSLLKRNYTEPPIRITSEGVEMVGPSEYLGEVLGGMQRRESAFEDIANNEKVLAYLNFVNRWPDLAAAIRIKLPESYRLDYNGNGQIDYDDEDRYTGWKELKNDTSRKIAMGLGFGAEVASPDLFDVAGPILSAGARGSLRAIRYNPSAVKVLRDEAAALADGDLETAASKARELGYRQGVSQEKAALDAEAVSSGNAPALANAAIVVDSVVAQEMRLAGKADEMFDTALVESLPVVKAEDAGDTLLDVERRKGYLHGSQRGKGDEDALPTEGRRSRYGYKRALDDLDAMEAAVKRGEGYFPEKIKAATADSLAEAAAVNDGAKVAVKAAADMIHRNRMSEAIRVAEAGLKAADIPADDAAKVIAKVKEAADKAVEANKKALAEAPAAIERARKGVAQQVASRQRAVQELADFTENVEGRGRIGRWMNQNLPAIDRQLARFRQPGSFTSFVTRQSLLDAAAAMTVEQKQKRLKGALDGVESARKRKAAAEAAALKATASNDQAKIDAANKAIDAAREELVKAHEQVAAALTDGRVNGLSAGGYRLLGRLVDAFDDRFNEAELAATAVQYEGRALKMVEDGLEASAEAWLDKQTFMVAKAVPVGSTDEVLESSVKRPIPPGNRGFDVGIEPLPIYRSLDELPPEDRAAVETLRGLRQRLDALAADTEEIRQTVASGSQPPAETARLRQRLSDNRVERKRIDAAADSLRPLFGSEDLYTPWALDDNALLAKINRPRKEQYQKLRERRARMMEQSAEPLAEPVPYKSFEDMPPDLQAKGREYLRLAAEYSTRAKQRLQQMSDLKNLPSDSPEAASLREALSLALAKQRETQAAVDALGFPFGQAMLRLPDPTEEDVIAAVNYRRLADYTKRKVNADQGILSSVDPRVRRSKTGEVETAPVDLRYRHTISDDIPTMVKEVQDLPWFHGARQGDIQLADYDVRIHSGTRDGNMFGPGLYLAENPEVAISYAASAGQKLGTGTEGKSALKAVAVKPERLLDIRLSLAEKKGLTLGEYVEQQLLAGGVDGRLAGYFAGAEDPAEVGEVLNSLRFGRNELLLEATGVADQLGPELFDLFMQFGNDPVRIVAELRVWRDELREAIASGVALSGADKSLANIEEAIRLVEAGPVTNDFETLATHFDGLLHTGHKDGNVLVLFDPNDRLKTPLVDGQPPPRGGRAILKSESRALPEQILYQFAGEEGAKNLAESRKQLNLPGIDERYSLATAKQRILTGENPEIVRQQTGWFLGMDDKWRFEIDDSQAAWKGDAVRWLEEGGDSVEAGQDWLVLEDVLDHPTLFEAYPGLRRMPIAFYDFEMAAGFSGKTGGITIGTKAKPGAQRGMESLMHEIQHAIQVQEGFAVGGTPRLTAWAVPAYRPALVEAANRIKNKKPLTIQEYAQQAWKSDKITPEIKADYDWSYLPSFTAPGDVKVQEMAAEDVYQRLAGEIEARNTAARKEMTAAERRTKAPDTDRADVVVVFRGKEMRSEPANVAESGLRRDDADQLLDQAKAFVRFSADGSAVVALMEKGDFSSLIHETAHIFRRTLSNKDNETVVKWTRSLGLDVSLDNGRFIGPDAIKAEEAFARGYERFVREGKSPVKALTLAFEKMRDWMLATYKAVKESPIDVKLNPDIEAVFANMTTPKAWMDEVKPTVMGEKIAPAMTAQSWLSARLTRAGVNMSADDIERRLAAGETIELPFKVFGKNEINEEDLAKIQSSLDRVSALQETKVDFTVPFDNVQQSVVEPTLVGELQSTMSADPTLRDTQAATRKVGRVIGRAVSAVMTGADALKNERVFSPRIRALAAEGGRILNQRVGDFNVLMRDASRSSDYQHLFDYMTGKDVKFSIGGRKPLSAGHDAVDEASQILQGQHGKLASDISIKTNKVDYGNPEDMPKDGWLGRDGSIVTDESLAAPPAQVVGDTVTLAFDAGAIADRDTRGARLAALFDGPNGRAHMLKTRATAIHMMESSPFLRHLATAVFDISDVDETRTAAEIIGTVAPDRILAYLEAVYKLAGGKIDVIEVGRRGLVFDPDLTSEEKVKAFFDVLTREKFGPVAVNRALSVVNVFGSQKTVYNRVADIGMTFSGDERKAFRNFLNGGFTTPQEYAAGLRMFAEFGFNYDALDEAAKVAGSLKSTRYMPNNVQRQIGRSLGRALDESTEVEKKVKGSGGRVPLFIKSPMQAVQSMLVRGRYIPKSAKVWMDLLDTGVMSGAVGGFSLGIESVVRQALQSAFVSVQGHALTKLTTLGYVKTNQVREALQWIADQLVDRATGREFVASVNDTLRGANKVIRMPDGRRYTYSDLLQTAIANGVVASFETSELSENVRKAVEVGLARRFPGLPADAINWTDARKEEWIKANSELFETWAERERIGVMLGLMHRGQTPEQAARLTVKALFDYPGSLADTETKGSWSGLFLSLAQPYWTWTKNITHFLINALEEPAVQYRLGVIRRASEWGPEAVSQALYTVMVDPYGFDLDRMSPEERRIYFYLRAAYEESLGKESWQMSEEERLNFAAALWATHFQASETITNGALFHLRAEDAREVERRLRGSTAAMTLSEKYVPRPDINSVPDHQRGRIRAVLPFRNSAAMLDYIRNTDQQDLMMSLVFYEPGPIGGYNYLINAFRFVTAPLGILAATVAEQPTIDATLTARYIDGLANPDRMPLVSETIVFLQGGSKTRLAGPVAQMFQSSDVADRLLVYRKMEPVAKESYDRDIANGVDPREAGRRYGQVVYANPLVNLLFGIHPLLYDFNRAARMLETRGAFARDDELANIRKVLLLSGVVSDVGEVSQRKTEERTVYEIPRKTVPR